MREGRMAGFEGMAQSKEEAEMSLGAIRDQWEIQFSRFVWYPSSSSTNTNLRPLPPCARNRPPRGTWISSSSTVFLQLLHHCSSSDFILVVRFRDNILVSFYLLSLCTSTFLRYETFFKFFPLNIIRSLLQFPRSLCFMH